MTDTITCKCGCVNEVDARCGALRSILKCDHHKSQQRECGELSEDYYRELGVFDHPSNHEEEFVEVFGQLPSGNDTAHALEIGPGCSGYAKMIIDSGYLYEVCEPSVFAISWLNERHRVLVKHRGTFEAMPESTGIYDMILAAHSLEHMGDAPAMLEKMRRMLTATGVLYVIVPDDSDLTNPDHLWFFNQSTLRRATELAGLTVDILEIRRRVPHENFLYLKAHK